MNDKRGQFWETFAQRLSGARKMAGLSYRELSERVDRVVSYQTLSNWEKGKGDALPPMEIIRSLAKELCVRYDFFFEPIREQIPQPEFRKRKSKLKKREETSILEQAQFSLDRYLELEELAGLDVQVDNPVADQTIRSHADVERAAEKLRLEWELGINAIPKVVEMLEEQGIRVLEAIGPDSFDGLAAWAGSIPFMLVNSECQEVCRLRFTLLHELGHLFLKFPKSMEESDKEALCNRFASALLFPAREFRSHFGEKRKHLSLQELISLKEEWGMSIAAIVRRASDLKLISKEAYTRFCIAYNKRGYRTDEPGEYPMQERPLRFQQLVLRAYAEEIISGTKAAYFMNESYDRFHKNCQIVA